MKTSIYALVFAFSMMAFACSEDEKAPVSFDPNEKGSLSVEFDNVVGSKNLQLGGQQNYTNSTGEAFNVTVFDYYISNIVLTDANNKQYVVPQDSSYFLIQESDRASQTIKLKNIPAGDYTSITFTIGIDSLRNTMDIGKRTGALDPAKGMYWSWNSGYIFLKLEGESSAAPEDAGGKFRYHIGGFGGMKEQTIKNIKVVTCSFGSSKATVRTSISPTVHLLADVLNVFNGSAPLVIAEHPTVMFMPYSVNIANNYSSMFRVDHIHND